MHIYSAVQLGSHNSNLAPTSSINLASIIHSVGKWAIVFPARIIHLHCVEIHHITTVNMVIICKIATDNNNASIRHNKSSQVITVFVLLMTESTTMK